MNRQITKPFKFKTPDELKEKINEYLTTVDEKKITITGICLHLGIHKDTFYEYAKKDKFKYIIDMARLNVENSYELSLKENGNAGNIFALKNFGWRDNPEEIEYKRREIELKENNANSNEETIALVTNLLDAIHKQAETISQDESEEINKE